MTAASTTKGKNRFAPVPARPGARALVGLLAVLVAAAGAWGAGTVLTRSTDEWPASWLEIVQLVGLTLLLGLGLLSCAVALGLVAGYRRRQERARHRELERLEVAALSDSLSGLGNHRAFHEDLTRELQRSARTGGCFSVVMLDVDGLKGVNDSLGHLVGDEHLRAVADCVRATLRDGDVAYRTGGDEFMVLLPGERAWGAFTFAKRLQREVSAHPLPLGLTCGIAEPAPFETKNSLLRHADLALYDGKRSGRRIVVYANNLAPKPAAGAEDRPTGHEHVLLATALARVLDVRHAATRGHRDTVSALCVLIAQADGFGGDRVEKLRLAALLHDVGKIGVSDALLEKPARLDAAEAETVSAHVHIGGSIMAAAGLVEEGEWVLHHHEHFDGSGYPDGLRGEEIPLESRIILVADAFDAMTADRPYRSAGSVDAALEELVREAGTQFDPRCVELLRSVVAGQESLALAQGESQTRPTKISQRTSFAAAGVAPQASLVASGPHVDAA